MAAVSFAPVTEKNVEIFRVLNVHCLPVRYADKFYLDLLKTPAEFTKYGWSLASLRLSPLFDGMILFPRPLSCFSVRL